MAHLLGSTVRTAEALNAQQPLLQCRGFKLQACSRAVYYSRCGLIPPFQSLGKRVVELVNKTLVTPVAILGHFDLQTTASLTAR
jgi:hypothetical protein